MREKENFPGAEEEKKPLYERRGEDFSEHYDEEGGKLLYEHRWKESDSERRKYDYTKSFEYDEKGFCRKESGEDLLPERKGNAWLKEFEVDESGKMVKEVSEITKGPDQGHRWKKSFRQETLSDGKKVKIEHGVILDQGDNKEKEATGHEWETYEILDSEGNHLFWGGKHIKGINGESSNFCYGDWEKIKELLKVE